MTLSAAATEALRDLAPLHPATWSAVESTWIIFFRATGAQYIERLEEAVPASKATLDSELHLTILSHTHADYKHLVTKASGALAAWKALRADCLHGDTRASIAAWLNFISIKHDIDRPIGVFLSAVTTAASRLEALGQKPSDFQVIATWLGLLNVNYSATKATAYRRFAELKLDEVETFLKDARSDRDDSSPESRPREETVAKPEPVEASLKAYTAPRRAGGSAGVSRNVAKFPSSSSGPFRWCSANHNDQCRRCGRTGHIADRCIADMPQHVKDWVVAGCPSDSEDVANMAADSGDVASMAVAHSAFSHYANTAADVEADDMAAIRHASEHYELDDYDPIVDGDVVVDDYHSAQAAMNRLQC
ncbi:hypothetical protein BDZ89DRAFT_1137707 [Hymenopellis radicata]|nr:hypothetical protein BDZ89DRAFT_1137707 [Hymenopellis radicata]